MEYDFRKIEKKWQACWNEKQAYQVPNISTKPKYYVLDMFPYPSGAGLHVGHPLGYIASDIYARYKRLKGFNVLHPMGYDAFGLPAEQYAIEHGIHPAISTDNNINNFRSQLDKIGFCFDWDREVRTCDEDYYHWTQWIFLKLFGSYFNRKLKKAEPIEILIETFEKEGNREFPCPGDEDLHFEAEDWNRFDEKRKSEILMNYRLAYCGYGEVNWCPALGTVLANDEVINGVSERGGHPVIKKKLRQWYLRITEYADRLLEGLNYIGFSEAMKEMETNWIGKSTGADIDFEVAGSEEKLRVYTTRPDTVFGVDFIVLAPELEKIPLFTTKEQASEVEAYVKYVKSRSERERMAEKKISGCFTGSYAIHPFNGNKIPIWISEYVLAGYGTGAVMAVPCGDERDFRFAQYFQIPITNIMGDDFDGKVANPSKDAILTNSGFLTGMKMRDAIAVIIGKLEEMGIGKRKIQYRMRDAAFSRQRYWGEPIPIRWENGIAYPLKETELPLLLPKVDQYKPGQEGEGPLANIKEWTDKHLETNTMPGYAGSSWYFLRYMDPHNKENFCDRKVSDYWNQVDVYVGGTEHAVGHILYSRMWTKVLYDLGYLGYDEPYKKLINQGMIQGSSRFVHRIAIKNKQDKTDSDYLADMHIEAFISYERKQSFQKDDTNQIEALIKEIKTQAPGKDFSKLENNFNNLEISFHPLHTDVNRVNGLELDTKAFREWKPEYKYAILLPEANGKFICSQEVEKMSKSKFNTVNPDILVEKYGADTFRMYEMFLGPIEQSKPWETKGIEGIHRFLKKLWKLFYQEQTGLCLVNTEKASEEELKILHRTIKKADEDTARFSYNTAISAFMVCLNDLSDRQCHKKEVLSKLLIPLSPFAPHICEELWHEALQQDSSILDAPYPVFEEKYMKESVKDYPICINGKMRTNITLSTDAEEEAIKPIVLDNEIVKKWTKDKTIRKIVFVKGKMINIVVS